MSSKSWFRPGFGLGALALSAALLAPSAVRAASGEISGSGTEAEPFLIDDADDLIKVSKSIYDGEATYNNNKFFALTGSITLPDNHEWLPMGWRTDSPSTMKRYWTNCTFDGRGFTIYNLSCTNAIHSGNGGVRQCGFVGVANGVTVKNLTFRNARISGASDCGVIIGRTNGGDNMISNCVVASSTIAATDGRVAALCGNTMSSSSFKLFDCQVLDTTVSGAGEQVGGLIGMGQNCSWSAVGCVVSNSHVTTSTEGKVAGLACGRVNSVNETFTDLVVGGCGTDVLFGTVVGTATVPIEVRIDGDSVLNVAGFVGVGSSSTQWRVRQYAGKSTYNIPENLRVPGSSLSKTTVGEQVWYTINPPIYISNESELRAIAADFNYGGTTYTGKYLLMTNDITVSNEEWEPIGCKEKNITPRRQYYFADTFDGDGHTISGLTMKSPSATYRGFIGACGGGTVKNLTLANVDFEFEGGTLGAFVGLGVSGSASGCTLINCKLVDSKVSGTSRVGGLIAAPEYGAKIFDCSVRSSTIGGSTSVGAVIGASYSTVICSNVCVYADDDKRVAAFGSASGTATVGGASTHMEITNILASAGTALTVNDGEYTVAIPAANLAYGYENQYDPDTGLYKVAVSVNGSGTENDPYLVRNEAKLLEIAADPDKYSGTWIKLLNDIELTQDLTAAFGSDEKPFGGNFNGNTYGIVCGSHVTADSFFGSVSNLVVQQLKISLAKPLVAKVLEGGEATIEESTLTVSAADGVVVENDGVLKLDGVGVTNAANALVKSNFGACTITGDGTSADVSPICGVDSTGTVSIDAGRFHCAVPSDYVAEYYKAVDDGEEGWYKIVANKGSGTAEDPYVIISEADFRDFVDKMQVKDINYQSSHFKLVNDIELTASVDTMAQYFYGVFDGNGKTISNLSVTIGCQYGGLFEYASGAVIKNLTLKNCTCSASNVRNAAFFIGRTYDGTCLDNCVIDGCKLTGNKEFGGFVAEARQTVFSNCTIRATTFSGGTARFGAFIWNAATTNEFVGCSLEDVTLPSGSVGAFIKQGSGLLRFRDCVVSGGTKTAVVYGGTEDHFTGTAVIDGTATSMDVSGVGKGAFTVQDGCFSFDPTADSNVTIPQKRTVIKYDNGGTYWWRVIPAGTSFMIL